MLKKQTLCIGHNNQDFILFPWKSRLSFHEYLCFVHKLVLVLGKLCWAVLCDKWSVSKTFSIHSHEFWWKFCSSEILCLVGYLIHFSFYHPTIQSNSLATLYSPKKDKRWGFSPHDNNTGMLKLIGAIIFLSFSSVHIKVALLEKYKKKSKK